MSQLKIKQREEQDTLAKLELAFIKTAQYRPYNTMTTHAEEPPIKFKLYGLRNTEETPEDNPLALDCYTKFVPIDQASETNATFSKSNGLEVTANSDWGL
jgi:hypothetical protein